MSGLLTRKKNILFIYLLIVRDISEFQNIRNRDFLLSLGTILTHTLLFETRRRILSICAGTWTTRSSGRSSNNKPSRALWLWKHAEVTLTTRGCAICTARFRRRRRHEQWLRARRPRYIPDRSSYHVSDYCWFVLVCSIRKKMLDKRKIPGTHKKTKKKTLPHTYVRSTTSELI